MVVGSPRSPGWRVPAVAGSPGSRGRGQSGVGFVRAGLAFVAPINADLGLGWCGEDSG